MVKYDYTAFCICTILSDSTIDHIGTVNPFRYKGYYYDVETQLFWVFSRYYSPELCRWISPDSIEYLDPQSINGLNLYAYCGNDPINKYDPTGHFAITLTTLLIGSGVAFATGMAGYAVRTGINKSEDFKVQNMFIEGGFNAVSGALSVLGGYLGGMAGVHNTVFTKLLSQKGDFWLRLLVENVFTAGFKLTNALIKPYFMILEDRKYAQIFIF